jgi:hypothetical protein
MQNPLLFQGALCYNRNVNQFASKKRTRFVCFAHFCEWNLSKMQFSLNLALRKVPYEEAFMPFACIVYVFVA